MDEIRLSFYEEVLNMATDPEHKALPYEMVVVRTLYIICNLLRNECPQGRTIKSQQLDCALRELRAVEKEMHKAEREKKERNENGKY